MSDWLHQIAVGFRDTLRLARTIPQALEHKWTGTQAAWSASRRLRLPIRPIPWNHEAAEAALQELELFLPYLGRNIRHCSTEHTLCQQDQEVLELIQHDTAQHNRSNITRTAAYLDCYQAYPELHWALLAHLVSRNGGYNMTDLKGGLLQDLLSDQDRSSLYRLLERSNALIFQDAYPQLQLYAHSRRLGRSCFHLLPHFHISAFMHPFWERFWTKRDSVMLSVALIINEQYYIEGRVIQHPYFQKHVTSTLGFKMNQWLQLNQVLFPLGVNGHLAGLVLEQFGSLSKRIAFGKQLYGMLFGYKQVLEQVTSFVNQVPHEGSRSEYWPGLFTPHMQQALRSPVESAALVSSQWLPEGQRLYSPKLHEVWTDTTYEPIPHYDWYQQRMVMSYLTKPRRPLLFEISHEHRFGIQKLAWAHDAEANVTLPTSL